MLRITVEERPNSTGFHLEGKLTGAWVRELERCWISSEKGVRLQIDLSGVSFVDDRGKALLARMVAQGAGLVASTPMMAALARSLTERGQHPASNIDGHTTTSPKLHA